MEYRRFENVLVLRLDPKEEIVEALQRLAQREEIALATVSGIGALEEAEIGIFMPEEKVYRKKTLKEPMEIVSLTGNLTRMDGQPYVHLHAALSGEDLCVQGGHLSKGVIGLTGELLVHCHPGNVDRSFDDVLGLNLLHFPLKRD